MGKVTRESQARDVSGASLITPTGLLFRWRSRAQRLAIPGACEGDNLFSQRSLFDLHGLMLRLSERAKGSEQRCDVC